MSDVCVSLLAAMAAGFAVSVHCGASEHVPQVTTVVDFQRLFQEDLVANCPNASAREREASGGVSHPGIFLHPPGTGEATLRFASVPIPSAGPTGNGLTHGVFLVFDIGIRDGVPWGAKERTPNGVRFTVAVGGDAVFSEVVDSPGWRGRAVELTPWSRRATDIEFRTDAIDGNTNFDWAIVGRPRLAQVEAPNEIAALERKDSGLALVEVQCKERCELTLSVGAVGERATFEAGKRWMALPYQAAAAPALEVHSGSATIGHVLAAPFAPMIEFGELALSSPLVIAGEPFDVVLPAKNAGEGRLGQPIRKALIGSEKLRMSTDAEQTLDDLPAGETKSLVWRGLVMSAPGDFEISCDDRLVRGHAFARPSDRGPRAVLESTGSRLTIHSDESGQAYAAMEVLSGNSWRRVGSIYPLAELVHFASEHVQSELRASRIEASDGVLAIEGAVGPNGWPVTMRFSSVEGGARFHVECAVEARNEADVAAFRGPVILAGDRAFGAAKQFAMFPGLEYLEGSEASSSARDLAPPHHDRRVPAIHKIAAPLMAVQGQDALVALLWSARQEWAEGKLFPAARFLAPAPESGLGYIHMSLFVPSVGDYVKENKYEADKPFRVGAGGRLRLSMELVLDRSDRYPGDSVVHGPHRGGLVLQAFRHWFDAYGMPGPSPLPRPWEEVRALCRDAYFNAVWSEDPLGWSHCHKWKPGLFTGHIVPLEMERRARVNASESSGIESRVSRVVQAALQQNGPESLWSGAACHIVEGELPFYYGYLPEALSAMRAHAARLPEGRENGLWVWRPSDEKHAALGKPGDHTLGQAARPAFVMLRAARLTGDPDLAAAALDAMRQMERYDVPRGAQMWECPLYQPDILAAAYAIRAYCEAYRLTGDASHLAHARYWAWSGLPFLYLWEMDGYPTMRYNVISVIGSTFYTHSWLGLPVVWCGLVYAYALQELAEHDDSFPWPTIAEGITNSAIWQQYAEGPSKGCYPDSWDMVRNKPNPADINPENILMNAHRLRGRSPEIRSMRLALSPTGALLNASADILDARTEPGRVTFSLKGDAGFAAHALIGAVPAPLSVVGAGDCVAGSEEMLVKESGWFYDEGLRAVVLRIELTKAPASVEIAWAVP